MQRLLITGAAGGIGRVMRQRLAPLAKILRLSDITDMGEAASNEELVPCDLGDANAVHALVEGCDAIVHLGGISGEAPFSKIMHTNLNGCYNLFESARANGQPRIMLASSLHATGFYRQDEYLAADATLRPDGLYGVSKCFSELMARMYFDKFGQETAIIRLGSCFEHPRDHRMLSSWMSYDDFASLANCVFKAPRLGCPIIWGVSNNDARWWDNSHVNYLGWRPKDNAETYRAKIEATQEQPDPQSSAALYQGGAFIDKPIYPDE